jgi:hypothetical protein
MASMAVHLTIVQIRPSQSWFYLTVRLATAELNLRRLQKGVESPLGLLLGLERTKQGRSRAL